MTERTFGLFLAIYLVAVVALFADGGLSTALLGRLLGSLAAAVVFLSLVFLMAWRIKRFDLVDAAWGPTFTVVALTVYLWQYGLALGSNISLLLLVLVALWGARLGWHIVRRLRHTDQEDRRYVEMRAKWRGSVLRNTFFRVYMVQALLAGLISVPVIYMSFAGADTNSPWVLVGGLVWLVGFMCEVVADAQLAEFIRDRANRGKLMTNGLWHYARHPNYFGEITLWWGIALITFASPHGWVGLGGAGLITYLILFVSGIPPKEKSLSKRPGWAEYVANTRQLVPLPK